MRKTSLTLRLYVRFLLLFFTIVLPAQAQQTTQPRPSSAVRARPSVRRPSTREETPAPALPADAVQVKLPAPITSVAVGNSGQYLFLNLTKLQQIAVFDVNQSKAIKYIPMPTAKILLAAGANKLFVGLVDLRLIQRWDLKTLKLDWTKPEPEGQMDGIAMGAASTGPLVITGGKRFWVIDADTFDAEHFPSKEWGSDGAAWGPQQVRVSFDGSTILGAGGGYAGIELGAVVNGHVTSMTQGSFVMGYAFLSGDGQLVFRENAKVLHADLTSEIDNIETPAFPADHAAFSLSIHKQDKDATLTLFCNADPRPLITLKDFPELASNSKLPLPERIHFIPQCKALLTVGEGSDSLIIRPFDLQKELSDSGQDFLLVESSPVTTATPGKPYTYQLKIDSKNPAVKTELQAGPPGMTIDAHAKLQWNVPKDFSDPSVMIIIQVSSDSGQTIFHNFSLRTNTSETSAVASATRTTPAIDAKKPANSNITSIPKKPPTVTAITIDKNHIQLPANDYKFTQGTQGHTLLLCGNQLAILAPDGFTSSETHKLPKKYTAIAERKDYYVALCQEPRSIDILNKTTLAVIRSRPIAFNDLFDITLHPTKPISYVSYSRPGEMPSHYFLMFDELTAEAHTDDDWAGLWLQMSPDGKFLLVGFKEIYQNGNDIIDNPDRTWIVPSYGSLDVLARYDLDASGIPIRIAHKEGVGGNGEGIRLSADGKVAAYLSHVGYPSMTNNQAGWDPLDLSKLPTSYLTKNVATPMELAFHPLLPLAASPGKQSIIFFNRATGEKLDDDLVDPKDVPAGAIARIYFSPDGKNLIMDVPAENTHTLYHAPLKLSPEQSQQIKSLPRPDKQVDSTIPHQPTTPLHKLPQA